MSISQTINVANLGQVVTNAGGITFAVATPTGTLGAISTLNVDGLSVNTGLRSVLVNVPCSAYQGSLNSASFSFRTFRSSIYLSAEGRPPFAFVNTEDQLFNLQSLALENGLRVDDYVIFNADDPLSDYKIGDAALFIGPIAEPPAENAWVRYPGGITSAPINPSTPVASTGVKVDGKLVTNDTALPNNAGAWNIMPKTESSYSYDISANGFINIDVTDVVKEITDQPLWEKNNQLSIIFEPEGNDGDYLFDMGVSSSQFTFTTDHNPVPPFKPQDIQIQSEYRALAVTWEPPLDDGGSPVIGYAFEYRSESEQEWTSTLGTSADERYYNIEGLTPGIYYYVRIAAANEIGLGDWATPTTPEKPNNNAPVPINSLDFNSANPIRVRIRRDYSAAWDAADPVLAIGEPGYVLDTNFMKVGDGLSSWTGLGYVQVPDSTINFPPPPDVFLKVNDNEFAASPVVEVNLSKSQPLTIKAENGIKAEYSNTYKTVTMSLETTFNPIQSGTISNPEALGSQGSVRYDNERIFICVEENLWKRVLQDQPWFNVVPISVSDGAGQYPSNTVISADGAIVQVQSNGDPYPAKAGTPLVNDGLTPRGGFLGGYIPASQNYDFAILYNGGESNSNPQLVSENPIAVTVNGVVIKSSKYSGDIDIFSPPNNFEYDMPFWTNYFGIDGCNGLVLDDLVYVYYGGRFVNQCWNTNKFYESNEYFNDTNFAGDYIRHNDGHSKIVGIAFDGYPIYGPFGYSDPLNTNSNVRRIASSYRKLATDAHRPNGFKYNNSYVIEDVTYTLIAGAFVQDYQFDTTFGDLDEYNGRYCKTPEYPNGTYAYFLTFSDDELLYPAYPYIIGTSTREQRSVL
jgi:hypothetical protein